MNDQLSGQPKDRWLWLAGIIVVIFVILLWGFRTAIQMEEGPGDDSSYSVYDDIAQPSDDATAAAAAPADAATDSAAPAT